MELRENKRKEMQYIDDLVFRSRAGDEAAGEELLVRFGGSLEQKDMSSYLGKFYRILRFGKVNYQDIDSRRFVSLFMNGEKLKNRKVPWYKDEAMKDIAQKRMEDLSVSLKKIPDEDLKQELRVIFFILVNKYEKKEEHVYFTGYLYSTYKLYLERHIKKLNKKEQMVISNEIKLVGMLDEKSTDPQAIIEIHEDVQRNTPIISIDDKLGNSWVRGLTCREEFKQLTSLDRLIIKLHYSDKIKDQDVGKKFNMHINTVYRRRTKAVQSVRNRIAELIQEGFYE